MFDIGFQELILVAIVALLVIGPERLPAVARTMGYWLGRVRGFVQTVQTDLKREIDKSEELKRLLEQQSQIKEMHEIIEQTIDETRKNVSVGANTVGKHVPQSMNDAEPSAVGVKQPEAHATEKLPPAANAVNDPGK